MSTIDGAFSGARKLRIHWQAWLPDGEPRAVVVLAHGASEHAGRYEHVAARLVGEGYAVYAIEHRGHGRSAGPRALIDRVDNAVADLDSLVSARRRRAARGAGVPAGAQHGRRDRGELRAGAPGSPHRADPVGSARGARGGARADADRRAGAVGARAEAAAVPDRPHLGQPRPGVVEAYIADPLDHHGKLPVRTVAELAAAIDSFPGGRRRSRSRR